MTYMNS